jgi:hypothetical protein
LIGELALKSTINPIETSAATQTTMTLAGEIERGRRGARIALVELMACGGSMAPRPE